MRNALFALVWVAGFATASAEERTCASLHDHRVQVGPTPLTTKLHTEAASRGILFKNGEFHEEAFTYIGAVHAAGGNVWHVALLVTIWGQSCRATARLLVFDKDQRLKGHYGGFMVRHFRADGSSVLIDDAEQESGNRIDFDAHGPPATAHFDDENFELEGGP